MKLNNTAYKEINSNGRILRGMSHQPSVGSDTCFIIIHGYFSSNKIGPHRLYVKIADFLAKNFGVCYRFDLSGMGESDGDISEIVFEDHVEDVINIFLNIQNDYKPQNTVIIAHCIGCNLVLNALERINQIYKEIIFFTPYFTNDTIIERFFTPNEINELKTQGYTYRKGLYSDHSFFYDNYDINRFLLAISQGTNYYNIIAATDDQFIPNEFNEYIRKESKNITFRYISGADHNFLTRQNELIDMISHIITDSNFSNFK